MPGPGDLHALRRLAARAAEEAGRVIREAGARTEGARARTGDVEAKGTGDYVTEVDRAAEEAVKRVLADGAHRIPVVGEELGGRAGDRYWLVDPLDGTTNFLHRFPAVGVSIALVEDGVPVVGAVHAPLLSGTTWTAARAAGADRDGREIRVSATPPEAAIVGTGFPFRDKSRAPQYLGVFLPALRRFEDLRRPGAVALDLAWVAAGVFDEFFELNLGPWDVAAGALLVREAGGVVTDWEGNGSAWLRSGDILAGPRQVHETLLELARTSRKGR